MNRNWLLAGIILGVAAVLWTGCDEEDFLLPAPATLSTPRIYKITDNSAMCDYTVKDETEGTVTERGICFSDCANPTTSCNKRPNGSGTGDCTCCLENLEPNTTYHVRAFATTEDGTGYSWDASFTTPPLLTDIEGNVYHTVIIGDQTWMAENLRVKHYRNGAMIPEVPDNHDWMLTTTGAFCSKSPALSQRYGYFYNYYAVTDSRGLAPDGWHVPSDAEWKILEGTVDSEYPIGDPIWDNHSYRGTDAGGNLKATTDDWNAPNTGATNKFMFSALPAGYRSPYEGGEYIEEGVAAIFWSSTVLSYNLVWGRALRYDGGGIYRPNGPQTCGCAVRCVKD